jgi:hypothetical protein
MFAKCAAFAVRIACSDRATRDERPNVAFFLLQTSCGTMSATTRIGVIPTNVRRLKFCGRSTMVRGCCRCLPSIGLRHRCEHRERRGRADSRAAIAISEAARLPFHPRSIHRSEFCFRNEQCLTHNRVSGWTRLLVLHFSNAIKEVVRQDRRDRNQPHRLCIA